MEFAAEVQTLAEVKIQRSIFQEDSLLPLLKTEGIGQANQESIGSYFRKENHYFLEILEPIEMRERVKKRVYKKKKNSRKNLIDINTLYTPHHVRYFRIF